jgi:hypothetical protein
MASTIPCWRSRSSADSDEFFSILAPGIRCDFIMMDTLVEAAAERLYSQDFARLALFAFHLANSGSWRNSKCSDERIAGSASELIRSVVWKK